MWQRLSSLPTYMTFFCLKSHHNYHNFNLQMFTTPLKIVSVFKMQFRDMLLFKWIYFYFLIIKAHNLKLNHYQGILSYNILSKSINSICEIRIYSRNIFEMARICLNISLDFITADKNIFQTSKSVSFCEYKLSEISLVSCKQHIFMQKFFECIARPINSPYCFKNKLPFAKKLFLNGTEIIIILCFCEFFCSKSRNNYKNINLEMFTSPLKIFNAFKMQLKTYCFEMYFTFNHNKRTRQEIYGRT